jgi:hypothetical protein
VLFAPSQAGRTDTLDRPDEPHLRHLRQLTNGGENAEAYFSFDGTHLSFQSRAGEGCDYCLPSTGC